MNREPDAAVVPSRHRADVDGLRAVAVLFVVAFHAGVPGFTNGFVGVDVFLRHLRLPDHRTARARARRSGSVAWTAFYARRVRRLLPALLVALCGSLAIGVVLLLPWELRYLARSTMAAAGFLSNVFIWRTTGGYFGVEDTAAPLLHTWSLAVEEQFYLIWPPVLLGLWRVSRLFHRPRAVAIGALAVIAGLSLVAAVLASRSTPQAAFLLMPFRVWQLAVGGLLAPPRTGSWNAGHPTARGDGRDWIRCPRGLPGPRHPHRLPHGRGGAGRCRRRTARRGRSRCSGRYEPGARVRPLVSLGRLSYGWYLWHWPLLTMVRITSGTHRPVRDAVICAAALIPAAASYRWVEQPIRTLRRPAWRPPARAVVLGMACVGLVAGAGYVVAANSDAILVRSGRDVPVRELLTVRQHTWPCRRGEVGPVPHDACPVVASEGDTLVLVGDSHAGAFVAGGRLLAERLGIGMAISWRPSCPLVAGLEDLVNGGCAAHNEREMRALLDQRDRIAGVLWIARYGAYTTAADHASFYSGYPTALDDDDFGGAGVPPARLAGSTARTIRTLTAAGIPVVVVLPSPEFQEPVPECLGRRRADRCSVTADAGRVARAAVLQPLLRELAGDPLVEIRDPYTELCPEGRPCTVLADGKVLFRDDNHLSHDGARFIASRLLADGVVHRFVDRG